MPDDNLDIKVSVIPGERIIELALEIWLESIKGQTPEQKKIMWDWWIEFIGRVRKAIGWDK